MLRTPVFKFLHMGAVALLVLAFTISTAGAQPAQAATFAQAATSASAHTYVFNSGAKWASAYYSNDDGCIQTGVDILVTEYIQKENIFPQRYTGAQADVFISQYDSCTSSLLLDASSPHDDDENFGLLLESSDFQIHSPVSRATLDATLTLFDSVTSEYIDVDVDLTWTAISPLIIDENVNYHDDFGHCWLAGHYRGGHRPAEVSGTITTGMTSFTVESSDAKYSPVILGESQGNEVYVNCY